MRYYNFTDGILISGYFNHFFKLYVANFKIFKNTEQNNDFILKKFNLNSIHNSTYFELKKNGFIDTYIDIVLYGIKEEDKKILNDILQ